MNNKEIKKELEERKELLKGAHRDSRMFPEMSRELISQAIAKTENLTNILKGRVFFVYYNSKRVWASPYPHRI